MKMGIRKPNLKSRVKARTTGKIKRSVKRTIDPTYGKSGAGWVKDPKKATYNKIYHKTTVGIGTGKTGTGHTEPVAHSAVSWPGTDTRPVEQPGPPKSKGLFVGCRVGCVVLGLLSVVLCFVSPLALIGCALAVWGWFKEKIYLP